MERRVLFVPRTEQNPKQDIPAYASNFYLELESNLIQSGFPKAREMLGEKRNLIDNFRTTIHKIYPYAQKEGSMFLSVDNPENANDVWRVKFKGTRLEEDNIPENPIFLEIAYWTMLGANRQIYTPTMGRSPVHPAVRGLDQTTIDYFNTLQKLRQKHIGRNL
jgi:hypothetical protein